jgi:hypothetical protein
MNKKVNIYSYKGGVGLTSISSMFAYATALMEGHVHLVPFSVEDTQATLAFDTTPGIFLSDAKDYERDKSGIWVFETHEFDKTADMNVEIVTNSYLSLKRAIQMNNGNNPEYICLYEDGATLGVEDMTAVLKREAVSKTVYQVMRNKDIARCLDAGLFVKAYEKTNVGFIAKELWERTTSGIL